ncbi:MAG: hypothetical protein IKR47_09390 [Lachnospiraceae bacterium]|nr:hypothetical protein [Lachnospiraceae bacterium]MCR4684658.1 hypothetical protein [Lachnospiraceae bacterium]
MGIYEDFSAMLSDSADYMNRFKRDTYADAFSDYLEHNRPLLDAIEEEYIQTDQPADVIDRLTDAFVSSAKAEYDAQKKSKRTNYLIDHNTMMVVYVLPALQEYTGTVSEALTKALTDKWNATFTQYQIKPGTFSEINGGFKRKLCYVTTAVCLSIGKTEDCSEIRILKDYRDGFLAYESDGKKLIEEYYDIAPTIVNRINKEENASETYREIYRNYISPCIDLIGENRLQDCKDLYVQMMRTLQQQYIVSYTS